MLTGKLSLITGASSGIGYEVAKLFAKQGATLVLVDIKNDFMNLLNELSKISDSKHMSVVCDVSKVNDVKQLFEKIKEKYSCSPSIIVNCAGIVHTVGFIDMKEEDFDRVINVNLKGTFLICQHAIRELVNNYVESLDCKTYASIVNISSVVGRDGAQMHAHYAASKSGVDGLTRSISKEFGKYKIRCNSVLPGLIDTPMTAPYGEDEKQKLIKATSLGRIGEPEEIAQLILFLSSDASSYITGASFDCNGGLSL